MGTVIDFAKAAEKRGKALQPAPTPPCVMREISGPFNNASFKSVSIVIKGGYLEIEDMGQATMAPGSFYIEKDKGFEIWSEETFRKKYPDIIAKL